AAPPPAPIRLFELSPRGVDYVVEACGRLAAIRPRGKVTPQLLRDTFGVRRATEQALIERAAEARGSSSAELLALRTEHDARLLRLLGLSPASGVARRYRGAVGA